METTQTINVLELASELADRELLKFSSGLNPRMFAYHFPNGLEVEEDGVINYTEEAQDIFNEYYDEFSDIIESCKE